MTEIQLKRAYEEPAKSDGIRLLVDRVWPRGVSKANAKLAAWLKDLAPSTRLRKWFEHDEDKWDRFQEEYFAELESNESQALDQLREYLQKRERITLVYGAKNPKCNNAVALRNYIQNGKL